MNEVTMNIRTVAGNVAGWMFGSLVLAIGFVNTFWGNDPFFGIFILLLSLVYFPPANGIIRKISGYSIHWILKIVLGLFILWAALGVGELFDKIGLMLNQ